MVVGQIVRKEFQRDKPAEIKVLGLVNHTHRAGTESFQHAVVRNGLPRQGMGVRHN